MTKRVCRGVATRSHILGYNTPNSISAGVPPQTPLEEHTALPQIPSWILGGLIFLSEPAPPKC